MGFVILDIHAATFADLSAMFRDVPPASSENLLEMQSIRPYTRPATLESALSEAPHVILVYISTQEGQLLCHF